MGKVRKEQSLSGDASVRTRQGPRQTLIRRVHAVIHVKREESDDESADAESKEEEAEDVMPQMKPQVNQWRKRKVAVDNDDDYGSGEGNNYNSGRGEDAESDHSDHVEDEEDENRDESDGEDDELMMGAEVGLSSVSFSRPNNYFFQENHHELYGTRRVKVPSKNHAPKNPPSPTKKRKLAVAVPNTREKPPIRKKN